jgi:asparagine synthase (glutamine-hydrolysing)
VCGICGLLAPSGRPDAALVERMNALLVHRGPDEGSVDSFGRCVLGHRRLRVIDLTTGSQPVANEAGDVTAVFNGELYNFRELRAELAGHEVRGSGDTPIIPHLYEDSGPAFVSRLEGMFAIALWDAARERLVLARDRVGKKPLLWTQLPDGTLAFASELKALLRLPELRREVDPQSLDAYLALQYVPFGTALRGVEKLPPGHLLLAENGSVRIEPYWSLDVETENDSHSHEEWLERVRETVGAAVRKRLVADVPLGALLSGGIDSSVVVAEMARAGGRVRTFTVGFGDERYDERAHARSVSELYGTEHEEIVVEPEVTELLPRLARSFDEPLGDEAALPQFVVSELARQRVTVALTGDGGDEAFAGYERYTAVGLAERVAVPGVGTAARFLRWAGRREPRSRANRAGRLLELGALPAAARYGRLMEVFPAELRAELWEPEFVPRPAPAWELLEAPEDGIASLQGLDVRTYLPGDLLLKADLASMAHSLELRSPLLDHTVLELGVSLPSSLKVKGRRGKVALRRAFADALPPEVARRGKAGFGVPIARWFRGELQATARDFLLDETARGRGQLRPRVVARLLDDHVAGRADHAHRLWCLLMLELWQREHVDAASPAAVAA